MKYITQIFILLSVSLLFGCVGWKSDDPYSRVVPKRPNWKFKTDDHDPQGLINYNVIYCARQTWSDYHLPWDTIRFWPDGQVMLSSAEDIHDADELNSFEGSVVGYFKVDGNTLIIETYARINFGQYSYGFYTILDDGDLLFTEFGNSLWKWTRHDVRPPQRYMPSKTERFDSVPDW